jgi:hypothetical protein
MRQPFRKPIKVYRAYFSNRGLQRGNAEAAVDVSESLVSWDGSDGKRASSSSTSISIHHESQCLPLLFKSSNHTSGVMARVSEVARLCRLGLFP